MLIIDDEVIVAEMYQLGLRRAGFDVLVANNGPAGLELAAAAAPQFIFLDFRMPGMDGIEVLKRLASDAETRKIPVVMLSNYSDPAHVEQCMRCGAKEYVVKAGSDPAKLASVVRRWVNEGPR